ncbi:tetratricopeptide repeat protein [Acetobacter thailandicus]|uniref:tetratricopeptide repeat protein n=1 Tax=Acetobacter thailandicus TaxID=1502842 RepID=UPI001BA5ABA5|nr:SEL1-like repeat protein [Acetobacter thailandicus]MBS1004402.1 SEL1-like repeat protein [Acetobacter thailandicus]
MVVSLIKRMVGRDGSAEARLEGAKALMAAPETAIKGFSQLSLLAREDIPEAQFLVADAYLTGNGVPPNLPEGVRWMRRAARKGWPKAGFTMATLYLNGLPASIEDQGSSGALFGASSPLVEKGEPNFHRAAVWAKLSAELGDVDGQAIYGYVLCNGPEDIRNPEEGRNWYRKAAEAGNAQGHLGLGLLTLGTASSQDDYIVAAQHLRKAADAGLSTALYLMGVMYEHGMGGCSADEGAAFSYYSKAAEQGVPKAQARLGVALMAGSHGMERDVVRGETWLRRAALGGDAEAAATLGDLYGRGGDLPPNYVEAVSWYQQAAKAGHAAASYTLGTLFKEGVGVARDEREAERWFRLAVEQGHNHATIDLSNMLLQGQASSDISADLIQVYRTKAEQGDALSAFNLAVCLIQGVGTEQSYKSDAEALRWLRIAADKIVNAQYWYGILTLHGRGTDKNPEAGRAWLRKAAEAGMTDAQVAYADLLVNGTGGPMDHQQALELYKKAAAQGHVWGMFSLGAMYGGGHDVPEDLVAAQQWFRKAAEKNNPPAQLMMGRYLAVGRAGEQDTEQAKIWYKKAAAQGISEAAAELANLEAAEAETRVPAASHDG